MTDSRSDYHWGYNIHDIVSLILSSWLIHWRINKIRLFLVDFDGVYNVTVSAGLTMECGAQTHNGTDLKYFNSKLCLEHRLCRKE